MIYGYIGKPRVGKSTILTAKAIKAIKYKEFYEKIQLSGFEWLPLKKPYDKVYSTDFIKGTYKIDFTDLGKYQIENSLIIIDEAGIRADNRNFKNIPKYITDWIAIHGHYKNDVLWSSQSWDVDKKLRDRTEHIYKINKFLAWSTATIIYHTLTINEENKDIVFGFREPGFFEHLIGFLLPPLKVRYWYRRSKYYKYFDSFECEKLEDKEFKLWK